MAKGIIIRYRIAEFNPCAGFSPNCRAVFVHTAHWASALAETTIEKKISSNMLGKYFIYTCKGKAAKSFLRKMFNRK